MEDSSQNSGPVVDDTTVSAQPVIDEQVNAQAQVEQAQNEQVAASIPTEAPVTGTSDTHINAFKQDVTEAFGKVHAAINNAEEAFTRLLEKAQV